MNKKHYNNVIDWTLKHDRAAQTEDSLATARAVFNNMGVALPNGSMQDVYDTIKTNKYMGWRACTMEEAQQAANKGTAAIGISKDRVVVLSATDEEEPVTATASVMTLSESTSAYAVADLEYYAYSCGTTTYYLAYQFDGVKSFSYAADGDKYLSPNFRVREFRCHDGSDEILIDMALVRYLQTIRDRAGAPINIGCGYRTPSYNATLPGAAANSYHIYGRAADIDCSSKSPMQLAQMAETVGLLGIRCYIDDNYVHVDTRDNKWYNIYGDEINVTVTTFYN